MRYKLPDALGGGEIEAEEIWGGCAGGRPEYRIGSGDNGYTITMPKGTPMDWIEPPTPPEPEPGAYLIGKTVCVRLTMGPRGCTWFITTPRTSRPYMWEDWAGAWAEVGGPDVTIVPLVAALPEVDLPWTCADVTVGTNDIYMPVKLGMGDDFTNLKAAEAEAMAAALLSAARSKP